MQYVTFSRIIECRTYSESGLLFQPKLIIVGRWVSSKWLVGRRSVGRWSVVLIKPDVKSVLMLLSLTSQR